MIFRFLCVAAVCNILFAAAGAANEEIKAVKARDLHVCGVSPELLEERKFDDSSSQIYSLSTKPQGKKCFTLVLKKNKYPELRYFGSLKKLDDLKVSELESMLGISIDARKPFACELHGWNGHETIPFRLNAKFLNDRLQSYKVFGRGVDQAEWESVKKKGE